MDSWIFLELERTVAEGEKGKQAAGVGNHFLGDEKVERAAKGRPWGGLATGCASETEAIRNESFGSSAA